MEIVFEALYWLAWIIWWVTLAVAGLFVLRVILTWVGANPFGRVSYHLTRVTEPFVRPLRQQMGSRIMRYDLLPLMVALMVLVTGLFISSLIGQSAIIMNTIYRAAFQGIGSGKDILRALIELLGLLYVAAIFLRFFLPFFGVGYSNKFFRFLFVITEPLLRPLRRIFVAGMFDFSPLIAMLIVQVLTSVIASLVAR
ncbi:MAG TPA: YggT family protein [Blastocatellia bacterium]